MGKCPPKYYALRRKQVIQISLLNEQNAEFEFCSAIGHSFIKVVINCVVFFLGLLNTTLSGRRMKEHDQTQKARRNPSLWMFGLGVQKPELAFEVYARFDIGDW
jgi:hypothetical protein